MEKGMKRILIIAEAGVNHNGKLDMALEMVRVAADAGADIIKFQTSNPILVYSKNAFKADYQKENTDKNESAIEMSRGFHLEYDDFRIIKQKCEEVGICFLSTPFDLDSVAFLDSIGIPFWKIPSGEITNYPYLVKIAKTGRDIILSTGMSTIEEIHDAVNVLNENGAGKITIMHCTTQYPAPYEEVNLRAMDFLRDEFGYDIGYSDHTKGIEVSLAAAARGAAVIEKHFTLDRNLPGPDHKASLEPAELKALVDGIRHIESAIGTYGKNPGPSELGNIGVARKSLVAAQKIRKGELFTEQNLTTKRPGTGISPMLWNQVIGQVSPRDFEEDDLIEL